MYYYKNPTEAFESTYKKLNDLKVATGPNGEKEALLGCMLIEDISDPVIHTPWRKFNQDYAEFEWQWYLKGDPNAEEISKRAKIWAKHMDENGDVRSNYGWQWRRHDQLEKVVKELKNNPLSRRAVLSIYDGKEIDTYRFDTPCTLSIQYQIRNGHLITHVNMRSNDIIFGFCNDVYCFAKLSKIVADRLDVELGPYFHIVGNIHIYPRHFDMHLK